MVETKTDVFEELADDYNSLLGAGDCGGYRARYAAAPSKVVKVPPIIWNYIDRIKRADEAAVIHNAPDVQAENWVIDHGDQFAAAWLAYPNIEVEK